jgi:hypothetical protein
VVGWQFCTLMCDFHGVFGGTGMAEEAALDTSKQDSTSSKDVDVGYTSKLEWASVKRVFSIRTNQLIFAQALPGLLPAIAHEACVWIVFLMVSRA